MSEYDCEDTSQIESSVKVLISKMPSVILYDIYKQNVIASDVIQNKIAGELIERGLAKTYSVSFLEGSVVCRVKALDKATALRACIAKFHEARREAHMEPEKVEVKELAVEGISVQVRSHEEQEFLLSNPTVVSKNICEME